MKVDRELLQQTEVLLLPEAPPSLPAMQWTGRCRWVALLVILVTVLGLWHQNWFFFGLGLLGQVGLLLLSLQFRMEVERLVDSGVAARSSQPWLSLGAIVAANPFPFREEGRDDNDADDNDAHTLSGLRLWWDEAERTSFRVGQGGELTLYVQGPPTDLVIHGMKLRHSVYLGVEVDWGEAPVLALPAFQPQKVAVTLETPVIGKFRMHGVELDLEDRWRLFRTYRYKRVPHLLRVLPAIPLRRIDRQGHPLNLMMREQSGSPQRRAGAGTELRDIREYRPGDARRNIVWKHSARLQKLLCREFESETLMSSYLLLDIGQSMRQGVPGKRPIDYASEVVAAFAKASLAARDAVGLLSFDGEIFRHDVANVGQSQLHRVLLHLEELHQMTEPHFAHMRLGHLAAWVGGFLYREGLLSRDEGQRPPTNHQTVAYLWDLVWRHPELKFPKQWESDRQLVEKVLRTFCQLMGVELPYRYHQWVTQKSVGLQESLEKASAKLHAGQLIAVLSDLDDVIHWDGITRALRLVRQRRQHVVFLCPFAPWFESEGAIRDNKQDEMLREIFTLEQWRRRQRVERLAGQWRIPVLSLEPHTAPVALLQRLQRLRLGGHL